VRQLKLEERAHENFQGGGDICLRVCCPHLFRVHARWSGWHRGTGVTPSVACVYAIVAAFLLALSMFRKCRWGRYKQEATVAATSRGRLRLVDGRCRHRPNLIINPNTSPRSPPRRHVAGS